MDKNADYKAPLFYLSALALVWALLLLYAGAYTTSIQAGMVFLDWPLSNASLMPEGWWEDVAMRAEHSHRLLGAKLGLLAIALVVLTQLCKARRSVRKLAWVFLLAVILQGLLGGLRVLLDPLNTGASEASLSYIFRILHACGAQVTLCLLVALSTLLSKSWIELWATEGEKSAETSQKTHGHPPAFTESPSHETMSPDLSETFEPEGSRTPRAAGLPDAKLSETLEPEGSRTLQKPAMAAGNSPASAETSRCAAETSRFAAGAPSLSEATCEPPAPPQNAPESLLQSTLNGLKNLRKLGFAGILVIAIFLQTLLGALMRHAGAGLAIPSFPKTPQNTWFPPIWTLPITLNWLHRLGALVVTLLALATLFQLLKHRRIRRNIGFFAFLIGLGLQWLLGIATLLSHKNPALASTHTLLGAVLLALSCFVAMHHWAHKSLQQNDL